MSTTYITSTLTTLSAELVGWTRPGEQGRAQRMISVVAVVVNALVRYRP